MDTVSCSFTESVLQRLPLSSLEQLENLSSRRWSALASHHSQRRLENLCVILSENDEWYIYMMGKHTEDYEYFKANPRFVRIQKVCVVSKPPGESIITTKVDADVKKLNKFMEPFIPTVDEVIVSIDQDNNQAILKKMDFLRKLQPQVVGVGRQLEAKSEELLKFYDRNVRRYADPGP
uniref:F-box domain-containing protein n=1 Tax=Steinernema glaseri TaxID=37863 RepID=A0A1I7Y8T6_9BILA